MNTQKLTLIRFSFLLACIQFSYSQELSSTKFGDGLLNIMGKDSTWSMKLGTRIQF